MPNKIKKPVTKNKNILILVVLLALIIVLIIISNYFSESEIEPIVSSREMMSTLITQQIYSEDKKNAQQAIDEVFAVIKGMEDRYSLFIETSDISKINENAGIGYVQVSEDVFSLIKRSKEYGKLSEGDFDITIAPVTKAWGITSLNPRVVQEKEREELIKLVGFDKILLDEKNHSVFLEKKDMELDLGAIAKGEACSFAREIYEKYDFEGVLLSVGGNILAMGSSAKNSDSFSIAIRDPGKKETGIIGVLKITDTTISTSGSYERFFEENGKTYHHIFDPKTAFPADTDLISVSIIAKDGAYAEYLSTDIFVKGKGNLLNIMEDENLDYEIIGVDNKNNIYLSKSLEAKFTPEENLKYTYIFR